MTVGRPSAVMAEVAAIHADQPVIEITVRLPIAEIDRLTWHGDGVPPPHALPKAAPPLDAPTPTKLAVFARYLLACRRQRDSLFSAIEFGEPAWDMMLDLYAASVERRQVSVTSLCVAAAVPPTTALRWLSLLTDAGHLVRSRDRDDGRRSYIRLSPAAFQMMEALLTNMRRRAIAALA